jgi:hypothetical protein
MASTRNQQNPQDPQNPQAGNQSGGSQGGSEQRSEGLLPAGKADDGRFEVAEEVNLDQQSDKLRKVGQLPDTKPADDQLPDPAQQSDG